MAELVIPNGAQLVLHWTYYGQPGVNVLGLFLENSVAVDQPLADALGDVVELAMNTANFKISLDAQTILVGVGIRDLRTPNQPEISASTVTSTPGTGTGEGASAALCGVVTLRTAKAGKSFRGRVYFSGIAGSVLEEESALIDTTASTAIVGFVSALQTGISNHNPGNLALAVLSRPRKAEPLADPPRPAWPGASTKVVSATMRSRIVGSQRRRLPKRP